MNRETLQAIIDKHVHQDIRGIERVRTGKFNTTFFVQVVSDDLVLRIAPPADAGFIFYEKDMMAREPELHQLLKKRNSLPVPEIFVYDTDHDIIERDYLIMERLPGIPASQAGFLNQTMWNNVLGQVGGFLKEVHGITTNRYGYLGAHQPLPPQPTWRQAFAQMWKTMIQQIHDIGAYTDAERDEFLDGFDTHHKAFAVQAPASLLHMDVWAQNILINREGEVTGLIDWDRACWGDPEIEFAVLDYCGISEPSFWRRYGKGRNSDDPNVHIRFYFYYLYELQKYIIIRRLRNKDLQQAERYKREALRLFRKM